MTKRCEHGLCNSDTRYQDKDYMKGISFILFPKPKKDLDKCLLWIQACNREGFTLTSINKRSYVCNKHFIGGNGPTAKNPDPVFATMPEVMNNRTRRRLLQTQPLAVGNQTQISEQTFLQRYYVSHNGTLSECSDPLADDGNISDVASPEVYSSTEPSQVSESPDHLESLPNTTTISEECLDHPEDNEEILGFASPEVNSLRLPPQYQFSESPVHLKMLPNPTPVFEATANENEPILSSTKQFYETLRSQMPLQWAPFYNGKDLVLLKMDNDAGVGLFYVKINSSNEVSIKVLGSTIVDVRSLLPAIPENRIISSADEVLDIVNVLDRRKVCPGYNETRFQDIFPRLPNIENCKFVSSTNSFHDTKSELLISTKAIRCKFCKILKYRLQQFYERYLPHKKSGEYYYYSCEYYRE